MTSAMTAATMVKKILRDDMTPLVTHYQSPLGIARAKQVRRRRTRRPGRQDRLHERGLPADRVHHSALPVPTCQEWHPRLCLLLPALRSAHVPSRPDHLRRRGSHRRGRLGPKRARIGAIGRFDVEVDGVAPVNPQQHLTWRPGDRDRAAPVGGPGVDVERDPAGDTNLDRTL